MPMPIVIEDLKKRFDVPDVTFEPGQGGLARIAVATPAATGQVYLHGAHVAHWQPAGEKPVIWVSGKSWFEAGKPIRGGVPICFPWFGPREGRPESPAHGFARLTDWDVEDVSRAGDEVKLVLRLEANKATQAAWPFDFVARHRVTIGRSLSMTLEVENRSTESFQFQEALHTYFAVGDAREVRVTGLENTEYLDKVGGVTRRRQDGKAITIVGETDRVYLNTTGETTLEDPSLGRRLRVAKSGSAATVVWNPWVAKAKAMPDFGDEEWPGMMCIETGNVAENAVTLGAGKKHAMTAVLSVERMG